MAMKIITPTIVYSCCRIDDCIPASGSMTPPSMKPIERSSIAPAADSAANSAAIPNANAMPTSISLPASAARPQMSPGIVASPSARVATGEIPIASATAVTPRTRAGKLRDENSGASRNSGAIRASTSVKASRCCSENRSSRVSGFIRRRSVRGSSRRAAACT